MTTEEFFSNYTLMLKLSYDRLFFYVKHKMMGGAYVFEIRMKDYERQVYSYMLFSIYEDKDGKIKLRFDHDNYSEYFDSSGDFQKYIRDNSESLLDKFLRSA